MGTLVFTEVERRMRESTRGQVLSVGEAETASTEAAGSDPAPETDKGLLLPELEALEPG
jgi:hypothetical protein